MGEGLHVQSGLMSQDGANTINSANDFLTQIRGLESSVTELLSIWRGPAAGAFRNSFDSKTGELMAFKNLLETRGENIQTASNILQNNEDELTARANTMFRNDH